MKTIFRILPWALTLIFAGLWIVEFIDHGVTQHYGSISYSQIAEEHDALEGYIISKRDRKTDREAFEFLNLFEDYDFDGKYEPWLPSKLGLVKFDEAGFIVEICQTPANVGDDSCPPQL